MNLRMRFGCASLLAIFASCIVVRALADTPMAKVPSGAFDSVIPIAPSQTRVSVKPFTLDVTPVNNAQFAVFVGSHPEWRRDRVRSLFADSRYLSHWSDAATPAAGTANQPVTQVSWYAARAYCEARGARLPTWYEWEFVAAAGASVPDARQDPKWKQQILEWYSRPAGPLPDVGKTPANYYGIRDLHGVIWEWTEDFNGILVSGDAREQGDGNVARFCGSGALTMEQKDQYAILMRVAMLSSLQAKYTTSSLGFRCAADTP